MHIDDCELERILRILRGRAKFVKPERKEELKFAIQLLNNAMKRSNNYSPK